MCDNVPYCCRYIADMIYAYGIWRTEDVGQSINIVRVRPSVSLAKGYELRAISFFNAI
jgi:hypothetical protein